MRDETILSYSSNFQDIGVDLNQTNHRSVSTQCSIILWLSDGPQNQTIKIENTSNLFCLKVWFHQWTYCLRPEMNLLLSDSVLYHYIKIIVWCIVLTDSQWSDCLIHCLVFNITLAFLQTLIMRTYTVSFLNTKE